MGFNWRQKCSHHSQTSLVTCFSAAFSSVHLRNFHMGIKPMNCHRARELNRGTHSAKVCSIKEKHEKSDFGLQTN